MRSFTHLEKYHHWESQQKQTRLCRWTTEREEALAACPIYLLKTGASSEAAVATLLLLWYNHLLIIKAQSKQMIPSSVFLFTHLVCSTLTVQYLLLSRRRGGECGAAPEIALCPQGLGSDRFNLIIEFARKRTITSLARILFESLSRKQVSLGVGKMITKGKAVCLMI